MKHERSRKNRASYLREMASGIRSVERLRTLIKFPEDPKNEGGLDRPYGNMLYYKGGKNETD